jgi:5-methylcytosine-specific restriction endonuclease McrA
MNALDPFGFPLEDQFFDPQKCFYCGVKTAFDDLRSFNEPGRKDSVMVCPECLRHLLKHYKSADSVAVSYQEYLHTDHWGSIRRNALEAADRRCQLCNATDQILDVHHRTYERLGKEKLSDLIVLCRSCHERHHLRAEGGGK